MYKRGGENRHAWAASHFDYRIIALKFTSVLYLIAIMLIGSNNADMKFIIEKLSSKILTVYRLRIFIRYHDRALIQTHHLTGVLSQRPL